MCHFSNKRFKKLHCGNCSYTHVISENNWFRFGFSLAEANDSVSVCFSNTNNSDIRIIFVASPFTLSRFVKGLHSHTCVCECVSHLVAYIGTELCFIFRQMQIHVPVMINRCVALDLILKTALNNFIFSYSSNKTIPFFGKAIILLFVIN